MRMTSKGQVTVPKAIRDRLGLRPGDDIEFLAEKDRVILRATPGDEDAAEARRLADYEAALARWQGSSPLKGMTTAQIMADTRETDIPLPITPPDYCDAVHVKKDAAE
jgi:AbrB family looped-hinge helix DNA binding protein